MKKLTLKEILSKLLCIAMIAVFFVLAVGSGGKKAESPATSMPVVDYSYEDDYGLVTEDDVTEVIRCHDCGTLLEPNEFFTPMYCDDCLYGSCVKCGVTLNPADRSIRCGNCIGKCLLCDNYAADGSSFCAECDAELS